MDAIYSILLFRAVQTFFSVAKASWTMKYFKMYFSGGFQFFFSLKFYHFGCIFGKVTEI